jgi:hypothetical protein
MADHFGRAEELRKRAAHCRLTAKDITSVKFEECYAKLADHYLALADLEESFAKRSPVMRRTAREVRLAVES